MANLSIRSVSKLFAGAPAVQDVSLDVGEAELVALLGPSGCGKTTLLRVIAGLLSASEGQILLDGKDIGNLPPHKRNTGMVFQNYALFPHLTVRANIAFGLQMRRLKLAEIEARVGDMLRLVRMEGFADRLPRQLSGGQQQRVAIARTLVIRPDVFLLDEPLSNLDARLRKSVGLEIRAMQKSLGLTTVFVTHDQTEALSLADRLIVMDKGRIVQSGTAAELYMRPASVFVATFLGQANLLPGQVESTSRFRTDKGTVVACDTGSFEHGRRVVLCIRPENVYVGEQAVGSTNRFPARIQSVTYLGSTTELLLRLGQHDETIIAHQHNRQGAELPSVGQHCDICWLPSTSLLLAES